MTAQVFPNIFSYLSYIVVLVFIYVIDLSDYRTKR